LRGSSVLPCFHRLETSKESVGKVKQIHSIKEIWSCLAN
jgi:hypothetical protein